MMSGNGLSDNGSSTEYASDKRELNSSVSGMGKVFDFRQMWPIHST